MEYIIATILSVLGIIVIWEMSYKNKMKEIEEYMNIYSRVLKFKVSNKHKGLIGKYRCYIICDNNKFYLNNEDLYAKLEINNEYEMKIFKDIVLDVDDDK